MLLKGVNKRVIVIKNPESEIFEEAYFIVKNKSIFNQAKENEMVIEANRIISDYSRQQKTSLGDNKNTGNDKNYKNEKRTAGGAPQFTASAAGVFSDDAKFFDENNFGASRHSDSLKYAPLSSGFKLVSSKKISGINRIRSFGRHKIKPPPKSFFIGIGVMGALILAARILEFILFR